MGAIKFVTSLIMLGLFSFAIIMFSIGFGDNNETDVSLRNDSDFIGIRDEFSGNLTTFRTDANTSTSAFMMSSAAPGDEVSIGGQQFKSGIFSSLSIAQSVMRGGFKKIFGEDENFGIVLTGLTSLLFFIAAMYFYKAWFGRNPD